MQAPHWPLARELRIPLQIGISSLVEGAIDSGGGMTVAVLCFVHAGDEGVSGLLAPLGGVIVLVGLLAISRTGLVGSRASDLVLGADGVRVEGGPRHGLALAWTQIDPLRCRVENDKVQDKAGKLRGRQLIVGTTDGKDTLLAEVWQSDDAPAFYVVIDEIRAVYGLPPLPEDERTSAPQAVEPAPALPTGEVVEQLRCSACGAGLRPRDAVAIACERCGVTTAVAPAMRTRLEQHQTIERDRKHASEMLRTILEQRGAAAANRWLVLALALIFVVPMPCGLLYAAVHERGGGLGWTIPVALLAMALVGAAAALTSHVFTRRIALRSCLVELGARRGADDDRPHCRACGGLLPDGTMLVRCVYCDCENLLGHDLRRWQASVGEQRRTLAELLEKRRAVAAESRTNLVICLVIAAIAAAIPAVWLLVAQ